MSLKTSLVFSADTEGEDKIDALANKVEDLGKTAGDAAPEFDALAAELRELNDQASAVEEFARLKREVTTTGEALDAAAAKIDTLATALDAAATESAATAAAQGKAAQALSAAREQYEAVKGAVAGAAEELKTLRAAAKESGDATGEYATKIAETQAQLSVLKTEAAEAGKVVKSLAEDQRAALAAETAAGRAQSELASEYERTVGSAKQLSAQMGEQNRALTASQSALKGAGIDTAGLSAKQVELKAKLLEAQQQAEKYVTVVEEMRRESAALGPAMEATFKQMGIRGVQEIVAEIEHLQATMRGLRDQKLLPEDAARATAALQQRIESLRGELSGTQRVVGAFGDASKELETKLTAVAKAVASIFAVNKITGFAKDAIQVADAYGQMANRIEMATDSAAGYDVVQRRLLDTANLTYRPLAEAQELYIRTADALSAMRYSMSESLDITDSYSYLLTTNAASADKASAAISAYTKSIESGKIEVDGWQSILAATPSIVDAISEATGRSGEEIRKLGVTGKLSVSELNEGLRQTVEANKAAAEGMNTTVADALTRLQNNWSAYIGEANRASGATSRIVELIDAVGSNLDNIADAAMKAGEVLLAGFAAKGAMAVQAYVTSLLAATKAVQAQAVSAAAGAKATQAQGTAAAGAATSIGAAATATGAHGTAAATAAPRITANAAAIRAQNAAAASGASAFAGIGGAAQSAFGFLSKFAVLKFTGWTLAISIIGELAGKLLFSKSAAEESAGALKDLGATLKNADLTSETGISALIDQLHELRDEGKLTADEIDKAFSERIGRMGQDSAEKLAEALPKAFHEGRIGAEDFERTLELVNARLEALKRADDALEWKGLAQGKFALEEVQREMIKAAKEGTSTTDALKKIAAAADFSSSDGIAKYAADMRLLEKSALATGEQIDAALRQRFASMTANELREFTMQAEMGLRGMADEAEQLARINEQVLLASFDKLGINAETAIGRISVAAEEAMDAVDNIAASLEAAGIEGEQAGRAIEAALTAAIGKADSQQALAALETQLKGIAESGKLSADGVARLGDAMAAARQRIEDATPGIQSAAEAFRQLGVTSDAELRRAADNARNLFESIRDSGTASARELQESFIVYAKAAIEANNGVATDALKAQAAINGVSIEADNAGKTIVRSMKEAAAATKGVGDAADAAADKVAFIGDAAADAQSVIEKTWDDAGNLVADSSERNSETIEQAWLRGEDAASRYAREATDSVYKAFQAGALHINQLDEAAAEYVRTMEQLDRSQSSMGSSAARGVEDLELRLLELNGTEEEIAAARAARERTEIDRNIARLEIDRERAQIRGDKDELARINAEISAYNKQIDLLKQIQVEEKKQRDAAAVEAKRKDAEDKAAEKAKESERETPTQTPGNSPAVVINLQPGVDLSNKAQAEQIARSLMPAIQNLTRRGV